MSYSSNHGSKSDLGSQRANAPSPSPDRSSSPGQLSLLPEYTEHNGHSEEYVERSNGHGSPSSHKWLTVAGIAGLAAVGVGVWQWWQGRSPTQMQQGGRAAPVELATVDAATVEETSVFTGNLEAEQVTSIQAEQSGRVARILVEQGQSVNVGTPLVRLSAEQEQADVEAALARIDIAQATQRRVASELEALRAERDRLQAEINLQEQQFARTRTLVEEGALAQEELDLKQRDLQVERANLNALNRRIQAAQDRIQETRATLRERRANLQRIREDLQDTTITAPFAGMVGNVPIEQGDYVQAGEDLTELVANDDLDLDISIPQERTADLAIGLPVEIIDSAGNPLQTGRISFISPQVEAESQFIAVEATFANGGDQLRDGQFVRSEVIWESRLGQPVVPQSAVIYQGDDRFVYVPQEQEGQTVAIQQPVELGLEQGTNVEILSGLQPGQRIIVAGIQRLGEGVPIQPTQSSDGDSRTSSPESQN